MPEVPGDQCDTCDEPYEITNANAKLYCFLDCPRANHVEVKCPNGHEENIFLTSEGFMQIIQLCKLPVFFSLVPSDEFMAEVVSILDGPQTVELDVPHHLLRELYDQMRHYEGMNGDVHTA